MPYVLEAVLVKRADNEPARCLSPPPPYGLTSVASKRLARASIDLSADVTPSIFWSMNGSTPLKKTK